MNRMMTCLRNTVLAAAFMLAGSLVLAGPVNVNTADAQTISDELNGVGLTRAHAIVEYREKNGPFQTVEELLNVKGIGERTLELNRDYIRLKADDRGK